MADMEEITASASELSISGGEEEDRISNLPDDVICHILTFMPTKHAVGTSVLSNRWKHLWKSVPNLDFKFADGAHGRWSENLISSFQSFVDNVLSLNCTSRVKKFVFVCSEIYPPPSRLDAWISASVARDVEHLVICLPHYWYCVSHLEDGQAWFVSSPLPSSFFNRKNLVTLELSCIILDVPETAFFPSLKTAYLRSVQFIDNDALKNLMSGCLVIEELNITRTEWDNANTLYISSPTLLTLSLLNSPRDCKTSGFRVVIDAPSVRTLKITDYSDIDYDLNDLSSLKTAYLDFDRDNFYVPDVNDYIDRLFKLLGKISHVKDLCLAEYTVHCLEYENTNLSNLPNFCNLTSLSLTIFPRFRLLPRILEYSPNLVTLACEKVCFHDFLEPEHKCEFHEPFQTKCLSSSLETIIIKGFEICHAEMDMLRFFLGNAMALKKMSIQSHISDLETELNFRKELLMYPRSSTTCQVEFSNSTIRPNSFSCVL